MRSEVAPDRVESQGLKFPGRGRDAGNTLHMAAGREQGSRESAAAEGGRANDQAAMTPFPGVAALVDQVRPESAAAVAALTSVTGSTPVLLTGDNAGPARLLARDVGISDVRAGLLPHDKVTAVRSLQINGTAVALVGDGVNDAPALAAADTGIAMGRHGSDLALETADVVLVRDDLATLATVIELSRRALRIIIQNLVIAAIVITTLVAIDLGGHLPLPLGVAGLEGSTVIVGLNGLRLLSHRAWRNSTN